MNNQPDDLIRSAFMRCLQFENECKPTGEVCHDKCGCALEMQEWIDEQRDAMAPQVTEGERQ